MSVLISRFTDYEVIFECPRLLAYGEER